MGQAAPRHICQTQEIAFTQQPGEWHSLGATTTELGVRDIAPLAHFCKAGLVPPCFTADVCTSSIEEVLVVHHDALRKVNFLLMGDELSVCEQCELPAVPECVIAARRSEIQRRHQHKAEELMRVTCVVVSATAGVVAAPPSSGALWGSSPRCVAGIAAGDCAGVGACAGAAGSSSSSVCGERGEAPRGSDVDGTVLSEWPLAYMACSSDVGPGRALSGFAWVPPPWNLKEGMEKETVNSLPTRHLPPIPKTSPFMTTGDSTSRTMPLACSPSQPSTSDEAATWELGNNGFDGFQEVTGIDSDRDE
mmetsp:Transcript_69918/g.200378  ORF Transcript_69918/g.200378 Transcript_69918/m.200378 type:complete len:306 (+) Transcript_69918:1843-2760(+)